MKTSDPRDGGVGRKIVNLLRELDKSSSKMQNPLGEQKAKTPPGSAPGSLKF